MPGTVLDVMVREGQRVREGQPLMTMEAMKMEHRILAPKAGEVISINYQSRRKSRHGLSFGRIGRLIRPD